jgi:hypothetical protein
MTRIVAILLTAALAVTAPAAVASADSTAQEVAYGTGSVLTTLVYAPFKATFCILGGVTGGLTLPFGGARTAEQVVSAGCGGTWAITPAALKGQERVRFVGGAGEPAAPSRTATKR